MAFHCEEHAPGRDVDLLDHAVGDATALGPAPGPEVARAVVVGDDERGAARRERELVEVHPHAVARPDARDDAVGRVGDDPLARAAPAGRDALPPGQDRLPGVGLRAEVRGAPPVGQRQEPDRLAVLAHDERAALPGTALRREEDRPRREPRLGVQHVHDHGLEIRPRHVGANGLAGAGGSGREQREREDGQEERAESHSAVAWQGAAAGVVGHLLPQPVGVAGAVGREVAAFAGVGAAVEQPPPGPAAAGDHAQVRRPAQT